MGGAVGERIPFCEIGRRFSIASPLFCIVSPLPGVASPLSGIASPLPGVASPTFVGVTSSVNRVRFFVDGISRGQF